MTYTLPVTYMACQTCHARIHCDDCERRLENAIQAVCGVSGAVLRIARRELLVEGSVEEDILLDALEELGIFVD